MARKAVYLLHCFVEPPEGKSHIFTLSCCRQREDPAMNRGAPVGLEQAQLTGHFLPHLPARSLCLVVEPYQPKADRSPGVLDVFR
jgi:hypothetical protein